MPTCSCSRSHRPTGRSCFAPSPVAANSGSPFVQPRSRFAVLVALIFFSRSPSTLESALLSISGLSNISSGSHSFLCSSLVVQAIWCLSLDFPCLQSAGECWSVFGQTSLIITALMRLCSCSSFSQLLWSGSLSVADLSPATKSALTLLSDLSTPLMFFQALAPQLPISVSR